MSRIFSSDHHVKVSPSIVVFTFFFLVGMYFLFYVRSVLAMLFCALIMMAAFNPGVKKLQRWLRIPRF